MDEAAAGLMGGEDEDFGYLDMLGGTGGVEGNVGDVGTGEGHYALVDMVGTVGVAMETGATEVSLYEAGLDVGDADGGVCDINAEAVGEGFDRGLRSAVDVATGVGGIAGHGADVDDVAVATLYHGGHDEACHGEQTLDVGLDHGVPVVVAAFVLGFEAEGEAGVVDEDIDGEKLLTDGGNGLAGGLAVADVEAEGLHVGACLPQLFSDVVELLLAPAGYHEVIAATGEALGAAASDAAGGTGDQCCGSFGHGFEELRR